MSKALNRNQFFIKEHVGLFKAANNYDILDPETQKIVMACREEKLGIFTKILRFTKYKRMTPFHVEIQTPDGETLVHIKRGISIFLSKVRVEDGNGQYLGGFKQKFFSIGGKFDVLDADDTPVCSLKGKWTSWDFKFMRENKELAHVSKEFAGFAKELFTSADNYMLTICDSIPADNPVRKLIMGAVMCIDMVLKE
nr:phospholipid scramblase-related protein [uncultured Desulfobacter sp.]